MLTSNRSDFRPYTRSASVTISSRRVRTRMHGGVAGVGGQPPPLCRSSRLVGRALSAWHRYWTDDSQSEVMPYLLQTRRHKIVILTNGGDWRRNANER